jgi:hypothetical protein
MDDLLDFKSYLDKTYPIKNWYRATLSDDAVREVRHRLAEGQSVKIVAIDMDISFDQVYKVRQGKTYKDVI